MTNLLADHAGPVIVVDTNNRWHFLENDSGGASRPVTAAGGATRTGGGQAEISTVRYAAAGSADIDNWNNELVRWIERDAKLNGGAGVVLIDRILLPFVHERLRPHVVAPLRLCREPAPADGTPRIDMLIGFGGAGEDRR